MRPEKRRSLTWLAALAATLFCSPSSGAASFALDKNAGLLRRLPKNPRMFPMQVDLATEPWPFARDRLGGIVNVHFLLPVLFNRFKSSLSLGRYLLIETVPAHGGNFLELPTEGEIRSALEGSFDFDFYKETPAGPPGYDKVTVKLLARRRN